MAVLALVFLFGGKGDAEGGEADDAGFVRPSEEFDAFAGGFPVPPLPGQTLPPSPRVSRSAAPPGSPEASGSALSASGDAGESAEPESGAVASQTGSAASQTGGAAPQSDAAERQAGAATTVKGGHE
mgnify:FL=1